MLGNREFLHFNVVKEVLQVVGGRKELAVTKWPVRIGGSRVEDCGSGGAPGRGAPGPVVGPSSGAELAIYPRTVPPVPLCDTLKLSSSALSAWDDADTLSLEALSADCMGNAAVPLPRQGTSRSR